MSKIKNHTIKNVFICESDNNLKLVDITFNKSFSKIQPVIEPSIKWSEISTPSKLKKFIKKNEKFLYDKEDKSSIDGNFRLLIPGGIDPHVHFDTPGFEFREDFKHASTAAVWGGTTTIIDMPCTSLPPVTSVSNMKVKCESVKDKSVVDYAFWGGVRGNDFDSDTDIGKQIASLAKNGVAGFKAYLVSGMDTFTDINSVQMLETAKHIKAVNGILAVHAEDKNVIESNSNKIGKSKQDDWKYYCSSRNVEAEVQAIELMIEIAKKTKCKIHIVHLSSAEGLEMIRKAKLEGVTITAETCPHYLYFTQQDFNNAKIAAYLKTAPPVKQRKDMSALWKGLKDGTLSFVTTDHAGCDPKKEKKSKDFRKVYGGIPGVEHRVPFLFSEGFLKGRISLETTINLLASNTAAFFKLDEKGVIKNGYDADFSIINLWDSQIVKSKNMHSKGKYTPFENV
ncbi:MAG: amidohydrolase family protein, partial [Bacteroidota bacterium]|nr:amidohydrolase family protein [Bacteroidota bacterium]